MADDCPICDKKIQPIPQGVVEVKEIDGKPVEQKTYLRLSKAAWLRLMEQIRRTTTKGKG